MGAWFPAAVVAAPAAALLAAALLAAALLTAALLAAGGSDVLDGVLFEGVFLVREEELLGRASSAANTASRRVCTLGKSSPVRHNISSFSFTSAMSLHHCAKCKSTS